MHFHIKPYIVCHVKLNINCQPSHTNLIYPRIACLPAPLPLLCVIMASGGEAAEDEKVEMGVGGTGGERTSTSTEGKGSG